MLFEELKKENDSYEVLLRRMKGMKHLDLGKLRVSSCRSYPQYYYTPPNGEEKYLRKEDIDIAKRIAQQEYNETIFKKSTDYQRRLKSLVVYMENNDLEKEYTDLPIGKKQLIDPIIMPFDKYAEKWLAKKYKKLVYRDNEALPTNSHGEEVRSKSECNISDLLHVLGIPFKHDYPVKLKDGGIRYVDFVLLHKKKRTEVYYEHFGMTNNPEYVQKMLLKIEEYADNNIILGKNFFFTFETSEEEINLERIKNIIIANCC